MTAWLLLFALSAEPAAAPEDDEPWLIATVRVNTGFPDSLGASLTVHAVPYVDVEGGGALVAPGWFVRAGPRYELVRSDGFDRLSVRVAALFGFKSSGTPSDFARGFHFAGTVDFTWWLARHLGLSLQLAGGGTFDPSRATRKMRPDLRLGAGVTF